MAHVYVLALKGDKRYVGMSENVNNRIKQHFAGKGAEWTKKHAPVSVVDVIKVSNKTEALRLENKLTKQLMKIYGVKKVRGGVYCNSCSYAYSHLKRRMKFFVA
jgi:predicted GIY-YIG superfamily endonuclease